MSEYDKDKGGGGNEPTVSEVRNADVAKNTFDGQKADVFVKTGQLGKEYLIRVSGAGGRATLIAVHL